MYLVGVILLALIVVGGWLFGYIYTGFKTEVSWLERFADDKNRMYYPHRYTSKGKRMRVLPWEGVVMITFLGLGYYLGVQNQAAGIFIGAVLGTVVAMFVVIIAAVYVIHWIFTTKILATARTGTKKAWDKACPPLKVVPKQESEHAVE